MEQLTSASSMPLLRMLAVSRIDAANLPDPGEVTALTASMTRVGVLQPLLVRAHGDRFVLIAGRKRLVAAQQAQFREVPCLVHTADDVRATEIAEAANAVAEERRERRASNEAVLHAECDSLSATVLPEIQHALTTLQRTMRLLPQQPAFTRERVAMRLVGAEIERAQWLVRCRQYLAGRLPFTPRALSGVDLFKEFRAASAAVALHGGSLDVDRGGDQLTLSADVVLLTAAVHGLVWALIALGETAGDPRVQVSLAEGKSHDGVVLTLTQPTAVLTQPMLLRFFDAGWRSRPGGAGAEVAVQLARYAAGRHGADLEVTSAPAAGTAVTLTFR